MRRLRRLLVGRRLFLIRERKERGESSYHGGMSCMACIDIITSKEIPSRGLQHIIIAYPSQTKRERKEIKLEKIKINVFSTTFSHLISSHSLQSHL